MASTYSTSLKLELIGNGDQSGTWGTTTNNNLGTLLEQAITGVQNIVMTNANYVLTDYNGVSDEARNAVLVVTGSNSAIRQIVCPLVNKLYIIKNATSGGYAITIGGASGSLVTIPNGTTAQVYCDSTNFYSSQTGSAGDFTVNGTFYATGSESLTGNLSVGGTLNVTGATSLSTGSISGVMTAPTAASGTNTTQLATTAFVLANGVPPTGVINMWPTNTAPSGYLLCDGTAVSRTTYSALYAVVGTTFGTGDGSTTFNLPNYTNRMPYGTTVGATGGSVTTTISQANLPNVNFAVTDGGHRHFISNHDISSTDLSNTTTLTWQGGSGYGAYNLSGSSTAAFEGLSSLTTTGISVSSGGSGTAVTTISPYLGINFIIKT